MTHVFAPSCISLTHDTTNCNAVIPSEPRNIEVVLVNASAVKVSWERPARTNGDLMGYYIYKEKLENGEPIGTKLQTALAVYDANKTSALISDLEPNTEYSFRVSALNRQGDGEYSEAKNIMTGGIPPSEPITQSPPPPPATPRPHRMVGPEGDLQHADHEVRDLVSSRRPAQLQADGGARDADLRRDQQLAYGTRIHN
ncbi:hypothetical protein L596_002429 [Steinernema carpocapsae]|uniref:Fibronectin type-III domain-containing protein n=1 Tax=Steinernema carpocapsae TaxID=34508 RepID=A0A4U8UR28_STECR|nr:hypothetical protein L596_002429 [Steinernema carpocapsae]